MTVEEYRVLARKNGYKETLTYIVGDEPALKNFLSYEVLDLELRTHLTKVIICRHFPSTGGITFPEDIIWFIDGFMKEFQDDLIKPWLTPAIKAALEMIISDDTFGKEIIGATFMFGVLEFYAKYRLGYRPENLDPFDGKSHEPYRKMFLGHAINKLKKGSTALAKDLNLIDRTRIAALKKTGIPERRYTAAKIADRLSLARNPMVHGETHNFYDKGMYVAMLYILFHFHGLQDGFRYEGT